MVVDWCVWQYYAYINRVDGRLYTICATIKSFRQIVQLVLWFADDTKVL